jgi:TonB family protein
MRALLKIVCLFLALLFVAFAGLGNPQSLFCVRAQTNEAADYKNVNRTTKPDAAQQSESQKAIGSNDVVPGKALKRAQPKYPKDAKKAGIQGVVTVKITVDEKGRVIQADAVSGNQLLRGAAEKAALKFKFEPTLLYGQPVKVSGVISFNFSLQ